MKRVRILTLLGPFAVLLLASCGRISLMELMETEDPGAFSVQPGVATVVEGASVDILAQGGFRPYSPLSLDGVGTLVDGVYTAPDDVGPGGETVIIQSADRFGTPAQSVLRVFARLHINAEAVTLLDTETFPFFAWGGQGPWDYYREGGLALEDSWVGWLFPASPSGVYEVEVEDAQGMRVGATVTVVESNPTVLAISPTEATTTVGGATVDFGIAVPGGHAHTVTTDLGSVAEIDAITWRYTPPGSGGTATVTLTDTDAGQTVTATVSVLDLVPTGKPLAISPAALASDLAPGEQVVFTASGGTPPYAFGIDVDQLMGTLETIAPDKVRYTAVTQANNLDWLRLTDAVGDSVRVKVKSKL